jgi:aminomethyltransferase
MKQTPLYQRHVAAGGKIIDFGGWALPVQYTGILEEHRHVRSSAGLFDVSHMGEVRLRGAGAEAAVQRIITNDVGKLRDGAALYTCVCLPSGGIVDDCIVYRHQQDDFLVVVNASNAAKDFAWFREQARAAVGDRVEVTDESEATALLAVQGPKAMGFVAGLASAQGSAVTALPGFHFLRASLAGVAATVARTGYTGEDGCEIFCAAADASRLWDALIGAGGGALRPIGLGARDTLRLEARLSLYGNDIDEQHTPHEAGLSWVVKGKGFVGEEALARQLKEGLSRRLVGFVMRERGIARHGYPILDGGAPVGEVTSGTTGPTVGVAIGLGYVPTALAKIGGTITVDCRGKPARAEIVKGPFYKRPDPG